MSAARKIFTMAARAHHGPSQGRRASANECHVSVELQSFMITRSRQFGDCFCWKLPKLSRDRLIPYLHLLGAANSADVFHVGLQAAGRADPGPASRRRRRGVPRRQRLLHPRGGQAPLRHDALRGKNDCFQIQIRTKFQICCSCFERSKSGFKLVFCTAQLFFAKIQTLQRKVSQALRDSDIISKRKDESVSTKLSVCAARQNLHGTCG